jgi:hypothetical protein
VRDGRKGGLKEWRSGLKGPDQEALTLDAAEIEICSGL